MLNKPRLWSPRWLARLMLWLHVYVMVSFGQYTRLSNWSCHTPVGKWKSQSTASFNFSATWTSSSLAWTALDNASELICDSLIPSVLISEQAMTVSVQLVAHGPIAAQTQIQVQIFTSRAVLSYNGLVSKYTAFSDGTLVRAWPNFNPDEKLSAAPLLVLSTVDVPIVPSQAGDFDVVRISVQQAATNLTVAFGNGVLGANCSRFSTEPTGTGRSNGSRRWWVHLDYYSPVLSPLPQLALTAARTTCRLWSLPCADLPRATPSP